ncbi:SMP-30/gluconolactonase/LRE family protein [Belliella marina]|uniref:SMP-30/gluconolactonase/LRE family protein n=1 Tax=Belliella marina TaxID=1644146 RepID=A0ABW4VG20_9BACT
MKRKMKFVVALLGSIVLLESCAIHPEAWQPEKVQAFEGKTKLNEKLAIASKIDLNGWLGPEDIVFDHEGNLYCGVHNDDFTDGRILKIDEAGNIEEFYHSGSWVSGLHFDKNNNLIALSHKEGLISISPEKTVSILTDQDENGNRFYIPNGLDIASDGKIYFSNTSEISAYTIKYGRKLILEMVPRGALYCYDPGSESIETLINGTYFGNGVVLSKDESYLLMVETTKYRILKYWLKGDKQGSVETFMDNLPGFPNGISIRENGTFWLGFTTKRNDALDKIHPKPGMKKLVYGLPDFLQPKADEFGMVLNISTDGTIIDALFDPKGGDFPEAGAVKEHEGFLYIGGDVIPYIGKYKL